MSDETPVMTREEARDILIEDNPDAHLEWIERYLDAWADYRTAQANISEHGPIVYHPRTGSPIDNPYLRIRDGAAKTMDKMDLDTDRLWEME